MAAATLARLLPHLRRLTLPPDSDAELLGRFVRQRDEEAFGALIARHGPMVLRACQRVIGDADAAQDAFQAVFLVLARRAVSLDRRPSLAGWLYGVAQRVALNARRTRRRSRTTAGLSGSLEPLDRAADPLTELTARDLLRVLEEEVSLLPEAYRLAVVLCCFEGLSLDEAAQRLHCSSGALRGKLERGRKRLHALLARRGVTLPAALAAVELARGTAQAAVPSILAQSTAQAALRYTIEGSTALAGQVSANTLLLTHGVLRSMWLLQVRGLLCVLVALGGIGVLSGALLGEAPDAPPAHVERAALQAAAGPMESEVKGSGTGTAKKAQQARPWKQVLANGITVEFVGVSTHPSHARSWWKPDGSPLDTRPYEQFGGKVHPSQGHKGVEFAIRVDSPGTAAPSVRWQFRPEGNSAAGTASEGERQLPHMSAIAVLLPEEQKTCSVRFGVASGAWTTQARGFGGEAIGKDKSPIIFSTPRSVGAESKKRTAITVTHNEFERDYRLVVLDRAGNVQAPARYTGRVAGGIAQIDAEFDMAPDQVREYQFQVRPFLWAEFPEVALRRGE